MSKSVYLPLTRTEYFAALSAHNLGICPAPEPAHIERSLRALVGSHRIVLYSRIPSTYLDGLHTILVSYKVKDLPTNHQKVDYSLLRSAWVTCLASGKDLPSNALEHARRELCRPCDPVDQAYLVPILSLMQSHETLVRTFSDLAAIQEALERIPIEKQREKMRTIYFRYLDSERALHHTAHPKDKQMTLHFEEKNRLPP